MTYDKPASKELVDQAIASLAKNNFHAELVETKADSLTRIKELVPAGASVMNGTSTTLEQIGYIDLLKSGEHSWNNVHEAIVKESDEAKKAKLRQEALSSEYYLGSVHALSAGSGELVIASNTGSQLPHLAFTSPNCILVVGTNKITPDLASALKRLDDYVVPLEDARAQKAYGVNTVHAKTLILHKENPFLKRNIHIIFVNEALGF